MNFCATHNQFYSTHCVYCGPAPIAVPAGGTTSPAPTCASCHQPIYPGIAHFCYSTTGQWGVNSAICARCGQAIYGGATHVCIGNEDDGITSLRCNSCGQVLKLSTT